MRISRLRVALTFSLVTISMCRFIHPGILQTTNDLNRMKLLARSGKEPWKTAYARFAKDSHSSVTYRMKGPLQVVTRDKDAKKTKGMGELSEDSIAALQLSQMWIITEETSFANKAVEILNAWGKTLKKLNGSDGQLASALSGTNFVNAAEIMRATYSGWKPADINIFETMVTTVLLPPASQVKDSPGVSKPFQANWGTSAEKFMVAAAVFTENMSLYDEAKRLIRTSSCANFSGSIAASGQSSESGRDQQHVQLGLGNYVEIFTTFHIQNDSVDWFGLLGNRLAAGLEYTAKFLLGGTVSYDMKFARCDANLLGGPWKAISFTGLTPIRPIWELGYSVYTARGLDLPWTRRLIEGKTPDGQSPGTAISDGSAWQTLRFRKEGTGLSGRISSN